MENVIHIIANALDASLMRQTAIAENIANHATQNYRSIEVNFEQQWEQGATIATPFFQEAERQFSMYELLALSVKNSTHYRALIKGLNHKFSLMKLALHGNN